MARATPYTLTTLQRGVERSETNNQRKAAEDEAKDGQRLQAVNARYGTAPLSPGTANEGGVCDAAMGYFRGFGFGASEGSMLVYVGGARRQKFGG